MRESDYYEDYLSEGNIENKGGNNEIIEQEEDSEMTMIKILK